MDFSLKIIPDSVFNNESCKTCDFPSDTLEYKDETPDTIFGLKILQN